MSYGITSYCNIKDNAIYRNGELLFELEEDSFLSFAKKAYKKMELDYPKFYKMDTLCKLAILSASALLDHPDEEVNPDMALLLSNRSSCVDVDKKHQSSIQVEEGYASPANFVYTLPNIALGEISIKYKLRSENSFFIFEDFNPTFMLNYANVLLDKKLSSSVLCAWIEVNDNNYNAFVYKVQLNGKTTHTAAQLVALKL